MLTHKSGNLPFVGTEIKFSDHEVLIVRFKIPFQDGVLFAVLFFPSDAFGKRVFLFLGQYTFSVGKIMSMPPKRIRNRRKYL